MPASSSSRLKLQQKLQRQKRLYGEFWATPQNCKRQRPAGLTSSSAIKAFANITSTASRRDGHVSVCNVWLLANTLGSNVSWHASSIEHKERCNLRGQKGATLWFTGLSASGKSTIAVSLENWLLQHGKSAYRLDGDNIRFGLNKDLGFGERDRAENIRRISEVSHTLLVNDTELTGGLVTVGFMLHMSHQLHLAIYLRQGSSSEVA